MMPRKYFLLCIVLLFSVSCSRSKTAETGQQIANIEFNDAEDFDEILLEDEETDARMALQANNDSGLIIEGQDFNDPSDQQVDIPVTDSALDGIDQISEVPVEIQNSVQQNYQKSSYGTYKVKKHETLMLISYKIYGDYSRWKELRDINQNTIKNSSIIAPGTRIKYITAGAGFQESQNGTPYLIKRHDTLSRISDKVYGSSNKWRPIWKNNSSMIPNPNRIFAGFTLYYPDI